MSPSPAQPPGSDASRAGLDRQLVSGVAWTAVARWASQIVSWGSLLLLTRLLSPTDFGLIGMTTLLLGFIGLLSEFGIGSVIVVMTELTPAQIRQLHVISVLLGFAAAAVSLAAGRPMALFFRNPPLNLLVPVMGIGFVLSGFRVVPQSVLLRDLKFRLVSILEATQAILQALVSLLLAWQGMHYWSLVVAGLLTNALLTLLFYILSPSGFAMPVFREIRRELAFSQRLLVTRGAWYLYSNADFAVAGRVLGGAALGIYNMAWNIAYIPVDRLLTLILRVTPSVLSKVQHDSAELRRYLRILTEGTALVTFPVAFGLALVADSMVVALFDRRWAGMVLPIRLLALNAAIRCLTTLVFQVQTAIRDVRYAMWQSLVILAALPPSFWYASRWGGAGIAAVWLIVYPLLVAPAMPRILGKIQMPARQYLEAIRPAALASLAMTSAVLGVRYGLPQLRPLVRLIAQSAAGAAVYLGILFVFFRPRVNVFLHLVSRRQARS